MKSILLVIATFYSAGAFIFSCCQEWHLVANVALICSFLLLLNIISIFDIKPSWVKEIEEPEENEEEEELEEDEEDEEDLEDEED